MSTRQFILALTGVAWLAAGPAMAQDTIKLNMTSTFAASNKAVGLAGKMVADDINEISDGSIKIKWYDPGAIVPAKESFDAISRGAVDLGWNSAGDWGGKNEALLFFGSVPFGPSAPEYLAWIRDGGGLELWEELYARYNLYPIPCGIYPPEGSGWFRKEIKTVDDLKGLKMRFFGLGALVMQKMGVSTQSLAAGDIYTALELGTIDATELSFPSNDLAFGFYQVAKNYYMPGWHQQSTIYNLMFNMDSWKKLSKVQQKMVRLSCDEGILHTLTENEAAQADAMTTLVSKGAKIHQWPESILDTLHEKWEEVVAEKSKENEDFATVWKSYSDFRKKYAIWRENGYLQ